MSLDPNDYLLEEYKDVSSNLRHYASMRFAQLTLFIATSGALFALAFKPITEVSYGPRRGIKIGGLVVAVAFWLLEERSTSYWILFKKRATRLEGKLSFGQHKARPKTHKILVEINATNAVRSLFISVIVFWIVSIIKAW